MAHRFTLVVGFCLLLSAGSAFAQTFGDTNAGTSRAADSVAVQRLFQARRTGGVFGTIAGAIGSVVFISTTPSTITVYNGFITGGLIGMAAGGAGDWIRFSKRREKAVLTDMRRGQPLPTYVQNGLKPRHYRLQGEKVAGPSEAR